MLRYVLHVHVWALNFMSHHGGIWQVIYYDNSVDPDLDSRVSYANYIKTLNFSCFTYAFWQC